MKITVAASLALLLLASTARADEDDGLPFTGVTLDQYEYGPILDPPGLDVTVQANGDVTVSFSGQGDMPSHRKAGRASGHISPAEVANLRRDLLDANFMRVPNYMISHFGTGFDLTVTGPIPLHANGVAIRYPGLKKVRDDLVAIAREVDAQWYGEQLEEIVEEVAESLGGIFGGIGLGLSIEDALEKIAKAHEHLIEITGGGPIGLPPVLPPLPAHPLPMPLVPPITPGLLGPLDRIK